MTHDVMGPYNDHKGVQDGAGILEMTRQVKRFFLSTAILGEHDNACYGRNSNDFGTLFTACFQGSRPSGGDKPRPCRKRGWA